MWILWCLLSLVFGHDVFYGDHLAPGKISNVPNGQNVFTIRVPFGEPKIYGRFLIDFNSSVLVLSEYPAGGPFTIPVSIGGHTFNMEYEVDYTAASMIGCPACAGLFPMGTGSPLWFIFKDVTITSSSVRFSNYIHKKGEIQCLAPRSEFCVVNGKIYDEEMEIHFLPEEEAIIAPPWLVRKYKAEKKTKGAYQDLEIYLGDEKLVIPSHILYDSPIGEKSRLNLKMHEEGKNYTILGNSVLYVAQFYKDNNEHKLSFRVWPVFPNYGIFSLFLVALLYTLFFRSMEIPPIYFISSKLINSFGFPLFFNMMIEGFVVLAPVFVLFTTSTFKVIFDPIYFGVIIAFVVAYYLIAGAIFQIMFWTNGVQFLGFMTVMSSLTVDHNRIGYVRLRIAREIIFETSVILSIFLVSFGMRQDSYASYLSFTTYIWFLVSLVGNTVSCLVLCGGGFSFSWLFFVFTSTFVNIVFWMTLVTEVCFPMINIFFPVGGSTIVMIVVTTHMLFIATTLRKHLVKTKMMSSYFEKHIPSLN